MKGGEYPGYPNEINGYGGLWDPHHFSGQNPALSGYPDILTAFNSDLGKFKHFCFFLIQKIGKKNSDLIGDLKTFPIGVVFKTHCDNFGCWGWNKLFILVSNFIVVGPDDKDAKINFGKR